MHPRPSRASFSAVRAFYNYLSERRVIPGSPAAGVKGPRLRREPRGRAITDEQVRRLLATATERGPETEAMVCLLVLNGLRVSEVCSADIEHLRREPGGGHSLVVRGKGGKEVEVALNERTETAVLQTVGARTQGPIFRRQDGRRLRAGSPAPRVPYNRQAVYRLLAELAEPGRARRRRGRPGRGPQPAQAAPHVRDDAARPRRAAGRRPGRRAPLLQRHHPPLRPRARRLARAPDPQARLLGGVADGGGQLGHGGRDRGLGQLRVAEQQRRVGGERALDVVADRGDRDAPAGARLQQRRLLDRRAPSVTVTCRPAAMPRILASGSSRPTAAIVASRRAR